MLTTFALDDPATAGGDTATIPAPPAPAGDAGAGVRAAGVAPQPTLAMVVEAATPSALTLPAGATTDILGDTSGRTVGVPDGAAARGLDAGTTVRLDGTADAYALTRNGSTVQVLNRDGAVVAELAAGDAAGELRFTDGGVRVAVADGNIVVDGTPLTAAETRDGGDLGLDTDLAADGAFDGDDGGGPPPAAPNLTMVARPTHDGVIAIPDGLNVAFDGDSSGAEVALAEGAAVRGLDAGARVNVDAPASGFTVARAGDTLSLRDGAGNVVAEMAGAAERTGAFRFADGGVTVDAAGAAVTVGGEPLADGDRVALGDLSLDADMTSAPAFGRKAASNDAPVVDGVLAPISVEPGAFFEAELDTSIFADPEGADLTYAVAAKDGGALPDWLGFNPATQTFFGRAPSDGFDDIGIRVRASDPAGAVTTTGVSLTEAVVDGLAAGDDNRAADAAAALDAYTATAPPDGVQIRDAGSAGPGADALRESGSIVNLDAFRADPRFTGIDGSGQAVAVLDNGIDTDHPHFGPDTNGDGQADRIAVARATGNLPADPTGLFQRGAASFDHGTHVTGTAASSDGDLTGVAPGAEIVHFNVFDRDGTASGESLSQALAWIAGNAAATDIAAVNLSLGNPREIVEDEATTGFSRAFEPITESGAAIAAAAGNSFQQRAPATGLEVPGADKHAISVGASFDNRDAFTSFSNRGDNLDLLAPGANIQAATIGGGSATKFGTSMATPHVTGLIALGQQLAERELGRRLDPDEVETLLEDAGTTVTDPVTGTTTPRIDAVAFGEAILAMAADGPGDDYADDATTAGRIAPGETVSGELEVAGDSDWVRADLDANVRYAVAMSGADTGGGSLDDPWVGLMDATGEVRRGTDAPAAGTDPRFVFTPDRDGTFFLRAESDGLAGTGTYTLRLSERGAVDDFTETRQTSGRVDPGTASTGEIEVAGDADWFRTELDADTRYRVQVTGETTGDGTLADPALRLLDGAGERLAADDDGGAGRNAAVTLSPDRDGTFFVEARDAGNTDRGTYTVRVDALGPADDYAGDTSTDGTIAPGQAISGRIETAGDRDWFRLAVDDGDRLSLALSGADGGGGTLRDPLLTLNRSNGVFVTANDDGGTGRDAQVDLEFRGSGAVFLGARSLAPDETGSYTLSVEAFDLDDFAADTTTAATVAPASPVSGTIEQPGDVDWIRMPVEAGVRYQIDMEGIVPSQGTLIDPEIAGLFDAGGDVIAGTGDDDSGIFLNAREHFTARTDGDVFVAATSAIGQDIGRYTVSVSAENVARPTVTVDDARVAEGDSAATVTLELSQPAPVAGRIAYATREGSAAAGADFESARGHVTFDAGATRATVDLDIVDDDLVEDAERFDLVLRDPAGAVFPDAADELAATVTITDTDEPPTRTVALDGRGSQDAPAGPGANADLDAGGADVTFTDRAGTANFVRLTNFEAGDTLELRGADEAVVTPGADTTITVNAQGTVSQVTLVGVATGVAVQSVADVNALGDTGEITFA